MTTRLDPVGKTLTEAQWQRQVVTAARYLGWACYHTTYSIGSERGYPDLTLVHPEHGVVWIELKRERGKPTPAQEEWLARLRAAGQRAYLFRPSDWPEVEKLLKGGAVCQSA